MLRRILMDVNETIIAADLELLNVRKESFNSTLETALRDEITNMDKERARHREQAHLKEIEKSIRSFRLLFARNVFFTILQTNVITATAIWLIFCLVAKMPLENDFSAGAVLLLGIVTQIMNSWRRKKIVWALVDAYSTYGIVEGVIKMTDFREVEYFNFEQPIGAREYTLSELLSGEPQ